ncbi:unnamed protein product [Heligmosomoides polygyrus]|uniref:Reverse transcriptase domain-containing protein n=1 Tax=Heligmosomoides polygyrus TaxID=6339 RepID=A0A183FN57_HELPZ|nr:unnamed protein product [Heligmosomoides polygyrus]
MVLLITVINWLTQFLNRITEEDLRTTGRLEAQGDDTHFSDAIFIARQVMEKYREKGKPCYLAFMDLEKAYDRLPRAVHWNALRGRGVSERVITLIRDMYAQKRRYELHTG